MKSKNSHIRADVSNVSVKQVRTFGKWSAGREQKEKNASKSSSVGAILFRLNLLISSREAGRQGEGTNEGEGQSQAGHNRRRQQRHSEGTKEAGPDERAQGGQRGERNGQWPSRKKIDTSHNVTLLLLLYHSLLVPKEGANQNQRE